MGTAAAGVQGARRGAGDKALTSCKHVQDDTMLQHGSILPRRYPQFAEGKRPGQRSAERRQPARLEGSPLFTRC